MYSALYLFRFLISSGRGGTIAYFLIKCSPFCFSVFFNFFSKLLIFAFFSTVDFGLKSVCGGTNLTTARLGDSFRCQTVFKLS